MNKQTYTSELGILDVAGSLVGLVLLFQFF
jgi:hypothetical protein